MSKTLSSVASEQFDSEVKHAFQGRGKLNGTTTERYGVVGDTHNFRKMGKGMANERTAPSADSIAMDVGHDLIPCVLKDWDADEYTDIFNAATVNFDEMKELSFTIANALGRRRDQQKLDAMKAGSYSATPAAGQGGLVGTDVGGVGTSMSTAKVRRAKYFLDDREVDDDGRYFVITAKGLEDMLGQTDVTSSDYNSVKALVAGEIDTWLGFKFITVGTRAEGGLTTTGGVTDAFAWHKSAVGEAIGIDITSGADWIAHKKSWLAHGEFKGNAVIRDNEGVVKVQFTPST